MQQHEEWLALSHVDQLGPITLQKLLDRFGSPDAILHAGHKKLQAAGFQTKSLKE